MNGRVLLVAAANPYPVVTSGCARLVADYQRNLFPGQEVYLLVERPGDWEPVALLHQDQAVATNLDADGLLAYDFRFVFFVGFKDTKLNRELATVLPSFCLTDRFPHPDVPGSLFRGILSHRNDVGRRPDLVLFGGTFDEEVFYPDRKTEELVVAVGRVCPDKRQLELVSTYRETIFETYGLPLHLVGGVDDLDYYREVSKYVDGVSVVSTIDPRRPFAQGSWLPAAEIAALYNRARLFVSASPKESFGMALIEAMACGTTCVINGDYWGFVESDLQPHVYGNIAAKEGSIVDLVAKALRDDVRIDASAWARRYSLEHARATVSQFIDARL